jgi:hypothetical protein
MTSIAQIADRQQTSLLAVTLASLGYHQHAIETILAHVASEGCLEGAPCLEAEDVEAAEGALETGFETVPFTSHAWDEDSWSDHGPTYWPSRSRRTQNVAKPDSIKN